MWTYNQKTGELLWNGEHMARGYSGYDDGDGVPEPGEGQNDPRLDDTKNIGPIPKGLWKMTKVFFDTRRGPFCIRLLPQAGTVTHGRSGFLIHGDSISVPGSASHGCIILPRPVRIKMWESEDHDLEVVSGVEAAVNVA
jgi:hypothetical protein